MPPARRQVRTLGSLQLVGYASNPTKVITELAFIADERVNALAEGCQSDVDAPLEVQFNEFMDGVNSRGKGTKARQRKMTVEQAAAVLLIAVQKGHVELIAKANDPHTIDVIKILPAAKRILATFLPKLRGYGDVPYDCQYRGAIALAKRHFFPKGKAPTKKELMALLLQTHQEARELRLQCQSRSQPTQTLGIQTSIQSVDCTSHTGTASSETAPDVHPATYSGTAETPSQTNSETKVKLLNNSVMVDAEPTSMASEDFSCDDENYNIVSELETEPARLVVATPVAPRSFNPYLTPVSNPRCVDRTTATPSLYDASPTPASDSSVEITPYKDDEGIKGLLQDTATYQGKLEYYYNTFVSACRRITFLEAEKDEIQRKFDDTKRKLDETEQRLREANADKSKLRRWVGRLRHTVNSFCGQLQGMTNEEAIEDVD